MAKKKAAKAKKATTKSPMKSTAQNEPLVVTSKVKAFIRSQDMMTASESIGALNDKIYCILKCAVERAHANRRSTSGRRISDNFDIIVEHITDKAGLQNESALFFYKPVPS